MGKTKNAWMEVECQVPPKDLIIVDCGYVNEQDARDRADRIFALGVSRMNLVLGPSTLAPRIHVRIPKTKIAAVLNALPISHTKTWFGATHSFLGKQQSGPNRTSSATGGPSSAS
jgi:hypothetical protein